MKNILTILAATTAIGLANHTYAADDSAETKSNMEYKENGGYESTRTTERTNSAGTTTSAKSTVDVDVDNDGSTEKTVKTQSVTDPKGIMNKKLNESETQIEEKARGGYKQVTIRTHADANGTNIVYKTTTNVDVDTDGNVVSTATTEKTVDPKGLMNKKTTTSQTKSVNGTVVNQTKKWE